MPLAAMARSVIQHLDAGRRVVLHVVDCGLTVKTRDRLARSISSASVEFNLIEFDASRFSSVPLWGRMSAATYCRLAMADVLPRSLKTVLWLDCDLIVLTDISALWDMDSGGNVLLAAQDLVVPYLSSPSGVSAYRELGLSPGAKHFNAGVMLVDLRRWREHNVEERACSYLEQYHDRVWFWDQEALNACLSGLWGELDPRWNQIAAVAGRSFFKPSHLDPEVYEELVANPWIVHFAGTIKPWMTGTRNQALFLKYVDGTEWRGWRPPPTPRNLMLGLYDALFRHAFYRFEPLAMATHRSIRRQMEW